MLKRLFAITLLAAAAQGCAVLETVDKGLYSVADSVTQRDRVTGQRVLSMDDRKAQIKKGNAAVEQFLAQARKQGVKTNAEVGPQYQRVLRIFNRLHAVSHLSHEKWQPIVVEADQWNAFTTGGTYFVVYTKLLEDMPDDNELANVIAHEMAHTVANHISEQQGHTMAATLAGSRAARRGSYSTAFTHEAEREADKLAVLYASLAGFDPYGGERIWMRQYQQSGNGAAYFRSHPAQKQRAQESAAYAKKAEKYYQAGRRNPDYQHILSNNDLYGTQKGGGAAAGEGGGIMALLEAAATGYQHKEKVKAEERRQAQQVHFIKQVSAATQLESSRATGANSWEVTFRYQGNVALKNVIIRGAVLREGAKQPEYYGVAHIPGVIRRGSRFVAKFNDPKIKARTVRQNDFRVAYDNAEPTQ